MIGQNGDESTRPGAPDEPGGVCLRLYLAGATPNSRRAKVNLEAALLEFAGRRAFEVEHIDVLVESRRAAADSVIVTPTLVAFSKKSRLVIIGDLSDSGKLRDFLKAAATFS